MYCKNCGKELDENAKFCDSCGTKTSLSETSSSDRILGSEDSIHFANINIGFQVSLQGISKDISGANGSFDPVDMGNMNADGFYELLQKIKHFKTPDITSKNQELCSPSVVVMTDEGTLHTFEMLGGEILYSNTNTIINEKDAIKIILGERTNSTMTKASKSKDGTVRKNALQWGSDHKDIRGLTPVRKQDVPPTDRINAEASVIDTLNSPHIKDHVIKSSTSKNLFKAPIAIALFALILGFGGFAVSEPALGLISIVVAVALVLLSIMLKKKSRSDFKLGFDWKYNVIWSKLESEKNPHYLGNANCITKLSIEKDKFSRSRVALIGSTEAKMLTSYKDDCDVWSLIVEKTDGSKIPLHIFFSESEAYRVLEKANDLLNRQI